MKTKSNKAGVTATPRPKQVAPVPQPEPIPGWLRFSPLYIFIVVAAVYFRVVHFDFIGFDDTMILKDRYFIIGDFSNLKLAFTTDAFLGTSGSFYRPLQTVSFMVDALLGGPGPFVYHLTNLVLHMVASLCVFWLLITLGYKRLPSLLLSLLFALHPMFVLMVAWVVTRGDLLLAIFGMLAFTLFVKSFRANSLLIILAHGVAFFLALLSKETAVALPPLCLVFFWFELRRNPARKLLYPCFVVWSVAGGVWYYLRSFLHLGQLPGDRLGLTPFAQNLRMVPELLGKLLVPFKFQFAPFFNTTDTVLGLTAGALLAWLIIRTGQKSNKRIYLGCLWFLLFIGPVLMFRNSDASYIFDYLYHRAYLPAVGLLIVLAELLTRVVVWDRKLLLRVGFASVPLLAYFCAASFHEVGYYHDPIRFFTEAIARTPKNALCYNNRGVYYGNERNNHEAALKDFSMAIQIFPEYVMAILNRGVTYENLGKSQQAITDLETGLRLKPNDPETIFRLGNLRYLLNDFIGAMVDYNRLLAMDRRFPRIYSKKAGSEAMLGQPRESLRDSDEALRIDPKDEEAYNNRGLAKRLMGNLDEAIADFSQAISVKTNYSRPFNNRGTIYLAQGKPQAALEDFNKAIELDSHYADAYSNRGSVEHNLGMNEAALKDLNTALSLNPNFADAYQNRGVVRNVLRLFPDAVGDFNKAIELKPRNGGAYLGRGIAKLYLGDHAGSCEDWRQAAALGSKDAVSLMGEHCK